MIYWNYLISLNCKSAQRWITIFAFISVFSSSHAQEREFETICWTEGALIEAYKDAIYNPQAKADMEKYIDSLEMDSFQTKDGHTIRGLVWRASLPKGYLLIAQGTSMLAAEIYEQFKEFSDIGLDVYLYDYRGFGESNDIETTLEGMISDYSLRIRDVHEEIDGVVFDSVPHKVPWYAFCPSKIDPIRLLPDSCENWLIIGAKKDSVIGRRASKLGRGATNSCGAQSKIEEHFGHVFMDTRENTIERITAAKHHFELLIESKINGQ